MHALAADVMAMDQLIVWLIDQDAFGMHRAIVIYIVAASQQLVQILHFYIMFSFMLTTWSTSMMCQGVCRWNIDHF